MTQLDLFGRKIPLRYRVRRWLDSNRRFLTLIGALIVFVTFVVKEGMNEHLKSVVDSLDLANQLFAIRGDNTLTQSRLNEIQSRVDDIQAIAHRDDTNKFVNPLLIHLARLVRDSEETANAAIEQTESSSENTASLLASIPYSKGIRDEREVLDLQKANLTTESHTLEERLKQGGFNIFMDNLWPNNPDKIRAVAKESETLKRDAIALTAHSLSLQDSAQKLRKQALEESELYRLKLETRYRYVTYLSYLLYTLGWTLGFAGRLFGVEELVGGED